MGIEEVDLLKLQPTDTLRWETILPLRGLPLEKILAFGTEGIPQVVVCPDGHKFIMNGNNRSFAYFVKGGRIALLDVQYAKDSPVMQFLFDEVYANAENLRRQGINSVPGLVKTLRYDSSQGLHYSL